MKNKFEDIDLSLFDIVDFLEDRGVDYHTAGTKNTSAGWISISCPFCGEHSNHMGINLENNLINCYKCSTKGSVLNLIRQIDDCSFSQAKLTAAKFILKDFSHLIRKERTHAEKTMFPAGASDKYLPMHDAFLQSRRYDLKFLERKYDIMYTGPGCDDWKFRVIIPVYLNQEIVTYVARDCSCKAEIKYKNCPAERCMKQVKDCLYGIDQIKEGGVLILVEGIMDAWRVGTGAVATFGTQTTDNQLLLLAQKRLSKCFVLFDSDATDKGRQLAHTVSSVCSSVETVELTDGDPDDLSEDDVWELKRSLGVK